MKCAKCGHYIRHANYFSHGMPVGPVCAVNLGIVQPKPKREKSNVHKYSRRMRKDAAVVQDGQLDFFGAHAQ